MVFYHKGKNISIAFLSTFFYLYSFAKRTLFRVFHSFFLMKQNVLSEKTLCFIRKNTLFNCKKQPVIKWIKCRVLEEIAKTLSATFQVASAFICLLKETQAFALVILSLKVYRCRKHCIRSLNCFTVELVCTLRNNHLNHFIYNGNI